MMARTKRESSSPTKSYPERELTDDTKWIICMWDIRGEPIRETAMCLKLSLDQVRLTIDNCKIDGYYDKVRRHIEKFDIENAKMALNGFANILLDY